MPIFDQGYQHWAGRLSGHALRWLAVTRHGVRALSKGKLVRMLLIFAWLPALGLVAFLALWGLLEQRSETVLGFLRNMLPGQLIADPQQFRSAVWTVAYSIFFKAELVASILIVLVVGPGLVSRDLRFNAFPLYFSRPLRRFDYFVGKLGVIAVFLAAVAIAPAVFAYLVGLAFSLDLSVIRETHRLLWGGVLYGLVIVVSAGTLMLALSSLSRRSVYVGLAWAGFIILTMMISGILLGFQVASNSRRPIDEGIGKWVADHPPPPGITMDGSIPLRNLRPIRPGERSAEEEERRRWMELWDDEYRRLTARAMTSLQETMMKDWRHVVSYPANLSRIGDWLLDTDRAWVTFGKTLEGTARGIGPAIQMHGGGRMARDAFGPPNERRLADALVYQFPVIWSVGVLAGLWIASVLIMTTRVKSLDRLK